MELLDKRRGRSPSLDPLGMLDGAARRQIRFNTRPDRISNVQFAFDQKVPGSPRKSYAGSRYPWIVCQQRAPTARHSSYRQDENTKPLARSLSPYHQFRPPSTVTFSFLPFPFSFPILPSLLLPVFPPSYHPFFISLRLLPFFPIPGGQGSRDKGSSFPEAAALPQTRCFVLCDRCRSLIPSILCVSSTFPFQSNPVD